MVIGLQIEKLHGGKSALSPACQILKSPACLGIIAAHPYFSQYGSAPTPGKI